MGLVGLLIDRLTARLDPFVAGGSIRRLRDGLFGSALSLAIFWFLSRTRSRSLPGPQPEAESNVPLP
jgi:hypothetical protein